MGQHTYEVEVVWTGNRGTGTSDYRAYGRDHEVLAAGRPMIPGTSDPAFRGDATRWNPEQLLVVSLSQCHMLWYLHLCADNGIVVTAYHDRPLGTMNDERFTSVVLRPQITITDESLVPKAIELHHDAHERCFIANSVNFAVTHEPTVVLG